MRFDDSLSTVLASPAAPGFGAAATWRQLVDLIGRGRAPADQAAMARLRALRAGVAQPVRAASARALAFAQPPAALVALFAEDELAVAAPVLRTATLAEEEWADLLPALTPIARSVLRHRRDLAAGTVRALDSFGPVDFVLDHEGGPAAAEPQPAADPAPVVARAEPQPEAAPPPPEPAAPPPEPVPLTETPFKPLGTIARDIPLVAEALRRVEAVPAAPAEPQAGGYRIADLVARIDAFQRQREEEPTPPPPERIEEFRFDTDAAGTIRWVDGVARAALVGVSLAHSAPQGLAQVDAGAAGAFRRRARFADARLLVEGDSSAAGAWRIGGMPAFDEEGGRFTGYRGVARRPRADEVAEPPAGRTDADSLRQLVHELRTPANAIAGFAELIETQLLGPVPAVYCERAGAIRRHIAALLDAIDDLDTAARIEARALDLRPATVALEPLVARLLGDLAPLARLRGAGIAFDPVGEQLVRADDRAVERLVGRLLAALLSACRPGERLKLKVRDKGAAVVLHVARPAALAGLSDEALLDVGPDAGAQDEGVPLLGFGFALRLVGNLAGELGGTLLIGAERLTLRLPAALDREVQAAR